MSIEAIGACCEEYEMNVCEYMQTLPWNGREITAFQLQMMYVPDNLLDTAYAAMKKSVAVYGNYIIGNGTQIGYCDQGHPAYHKYMQTNYRPILLCDHDRCPFELYKFMRYVDSGK